MILGYHYWVETVGCAISSSGGKQGQAGRLAKRPLPNPARKEQRKETPDRRGWIKEMDFSIPGCPFI
jgi:hypothetical protein